MPQQSSLPRTTVDPQYVASRSDLWVTYDATLAFRADGKAVQRAVDSANMDTITRSAMASVLAKVSRDRLMVAMEADHPGYGFADHKGYSTPAHSLALTELGPCAQHRYSFINVRRVATVSGARVVAECKPDPPAEHGGYR